MQRKPVAYTHARIPPPTREAPAAPKEQLDAPILETSEFEMKIKYDEPLYTEINIPLPRLAAPKPSRHSESSANSPGAPSPPSKARGRSRTLSSLSPFRRSSSPSTNAKDAEEWPRVRKDIVKSREVHAMMDLKHHSKKKRSGTIDALAVVPAVLVLSAELFTPGSGDGSREGKRKDSGVGRWEDGIR